MEVEEKTEDSALRTNVSSTSGKPIYKWYQTDTKVNSININFQIGIEINQVLEGQDKLQTKMTEKSIDITFPLENNDIFELNLDLWAEIVPENSKARVALN